MRTARWWLVGLMVMAWAVAAPVRAQVTTTYNPVEDGVGGVIDADRIKRCNAGTTIGNLCAVDADCPGSAAAGRCETADVQAVTAAAPGWAIRKTGRVTCSGTGTPVTLGAGWAPCWQLRITNKGGNSLAYVGYSGMTTADGYPIEGGTYLMPIVPAGRDCDSIKFRCASSEELWVITP